MKSRKGSLAPNLERSIEEVKTSKRKISTREAPNPRLIKNAWMSVLNSELENTWLYQSITEKI